MKRIRIALLIVSLASGCSSLPQIKRPSADPRPPKAASDSPMSQLGVALPAMKKGDERELKIIAADQMAKHGFYSEAVELYLQAEAMEPRKTKLDAQLAPALAGAQQFPDAIQRYRRWMKANPNDAALANNLAFTLMESGDIASAESEFRRALAIDPHFENASVNLGILLAKQRRFQEALAVLVPAIGESAAHHNLGVIAIELGDESIAQQEFSFAASLPTAPQTTQLFVAALNDSKNPR